MHIRVLPSVCQALDLLGQFRSCDLSVPVPEAASERCEGTSLLSGYSGGGSQAAHQTSTVAIWSKAEGSVGA